MSIDYTEIGGSNGQARTSTLETNWVRTYTRFWQAETSSQSIGPRAVREACPVALGQSYATDTESDTGSFCQRISVSEDTSSGDGRRWIVTAEYGPFNVLEQAPEAPLDRRAILTFSSTPYQIPALRDQDDNPVVNSAGDPFDPPVMIDRNRLFMRIIKNQATYNPVLANDCHNTINNAEWFGMPAKTWMCLSIAPEPQQDPNGLRYWAVTYDFALNRDEWTVDVLDQGMNEINASNNKVKVLDKNGSPVSSPWPLNADGTKKVVGDTAEFIVFSMYQEIDFSIFDLESVYQDYVDSGLII
jgi:hypothetical protein